MRFLLWKITLEPYRLARIQWILFRLFRIKPNDLCGNTKSSIGHYCHQPLSLKYCDVINDGDIHRVVCKCCGGIHIESSEYINPYDEESWISF